MTKDEALDLAQGYLDRLIRGLNMDDTSEAVQVRDAIKQARSAPVQDVSLIDEGKTVAPAQEPVALTDDEIWKFWWNKPEVPEGEDDSMEAQFVSACREAIKAAAHRPFVGLTDEEIYKIDCLLITDITELVIAIEAKLKEKNNG